MKTIGFYWIALGWLALAEQACGQGDANKLRNDPTYSTHNYKHANKAATARKWETGSGVAVESPGTGGTNLANYKRQVPGQSPAGGVTVPHTPLTDVATRNYKMQRPTQSTGSVGAGVARRKKRTENNTVVGD